MVLESGSEATWPCPVCGVEQNLKGKRLRSERAVAYHIVGKARNEWWLSGKRPHVRFVQLVNPRIDRKWDNATIVNEIFEEVREACSPVPLAESSRSAPNGSGSLGIEDQIAILAPRGEKALRKLVRQVLVDRYGQGDCCWCDSPWWRQGITDKSRIAMLTTREQRNGKGTPLEYASTDELKQIVLNKANWEHFEVHLVTNGFSDKAGFQGAIERFQKLRNDCIHGREDGDPFDNKDAAFVEHFVGQVEVALEQAGAG